jgi:hypothetical protein
VAISVLDVRDTFALPRVPSRSGSRAAHAAPSRRLPLSVLAAGAVGVVEALALLAVGLTGLDAFLTAGTRPAGPVVAAVLVGLAAWVVAAAGSGATVVDGAGRRGYVALAHAELFAVAIGGVTAVVVPLPVPTPAQLPLPGLVLLLLAVPVAKLLLAGSPATTAWIAAGPRVRERRPDPVARHRMVATVTLAVIGLGLGAVAVGGPQQDGPGAVGAAATAVFTER